MGKFEIVRFIDDQFELNVRTDIDNDTVWLSQEEMALLFDKSEPHTHLFICE